jgi:hypothetical protein
VRLDRIDFYRCSLCGATSKVDPKLENYCGHGLCPYCDEGIIQAVYTRRLRSDDKVMTRRSNGNH